jgi:hypothetical protein
MYAQPFRSVSVVSIWEDSTIFMDGLGKKQRSYLMENKYYIYTFLLITVLKEGPPPNIHL